MEAPTRPEAEKATQNIYKKKKRKKIVKELK